MPTLPTPPLQIIRFDRCDSTNRQLLAAAEAGAAAGTVYVAREQSAGQGRRGRQWLAAAGDSLTFSLLWTLPQRANAANGLPLAVGVALLRAVQSGAFGPSQRGFSVGLKWPNDIYVRRADGSEAKAGGILIETSSRPRADAAPEKEMAVVIGIGLNCLPNPDIDAAIGANAVAALGELYAALALSVLTPDTLLPVVLAHLVAVLSVFTADGFVALREEWQRGHLWQNRPVCVIEAGRVLHEGIALGVDDAGALLLQTASGIERIISGDVSLRQAASANEIDLARPVSP